MSEDFQSACWDYVLHLYAQEGVPSSCLALQDVIGVDVCVLLTSLYARSTGAFLDIPSADATVAPWRAAVVLPMREIRRTLKGFVAPGFSEVAENIRPTVKGLELRVEQAEIAVLSSLIERRTEPFADYEAVIRSVTLFYAKGHLDRFQRLDDACRQIARAARIAAH